jgi:3'-5' exoribonuclease
VKDETFIKNFKKHSAAKSVHHGFSGGLLEHTLSVAELCSDLAAHYDYLDRDLLVTAALCHDIGKVEELSDFPQNIYTDEGQLLGHIVIGSWMVRDHIANIPDFPEAKKNELLHCILSHHGKLEYGSPKVPMLVEAEALQFADNIDAKMETFREAIESGTPDITGWMGYNRFLEANFRKTTDD